MPGMSYRYPSPNPELYTALVRSYFRCLSNKAPVKKTTFHLNYEHIIHQLALDIENRTYHPGLSNIFVVLHPKPREVIAAHLRDRIVHHFVYDYMSPYWEKRFVPNSFACRVGKGPMRACDDLERFIRNYYRHSGVPLYYLQLDVQNFFPSIDLNVLYRLIAKHLENPLYLWLCKTLIFHRATIKGNFKLTCPKELWQRLPRYKSLFAAAPDKGLPIGNLTSQFFANVYMNQLDQFIAHQLKGRFLYWQRYVDDILFLSHDQEQLRSIVPQVQEFLSRELKMTLNVKKTVLQPLSKGLDHLGYWHKPDHRLVRQRVVHNSKERVKSYGQLLTVDIEQVCATMNSYMGYFRPASTKILRQSMAGRIMSVEHLKDKITVDADATKLMPVKDKTAIAARGEREGRLRESFATDGIETIDPKRLKSYLRHWCPLDDLMGAAAEVFNHSPLS